MSGPEEFHSAPNSPELEPVAPVIETARGGVGSSNATPNYEADDPDLLSSTAKVAERTAHGKEVHSYCVEMLEALRATGFSGEVLSIEFTATFRTHTIEAMPKHMAQRWVAFLISHGVHVTRKRFFSRAQALIECLLRESFIPSNAPVGSEKNEAIVINQPDHLDTDAVNPQQFSPTVDPAQKHVSPEHRERMIEKRTAPGGHAAHENVAENRVESTRKKDFHSHESSTEDHSLGINSLMRVLGT
ncbi:hypothetical protein FGB62_18g46 [Gracilaria domingensis]|nr:hypothetical protein FGB62_18g46 [Gracilaria domingensis]